MWLGVFSVEEPQSRHGPYLTLALGESIIVNTHFPKSRWMVLCSLLYDSRKPRYGPG